MTEKEVIEAIEFMKKYQTKTDKIETKTAEKGYPKKWYDTISAFANKSGGIIIFGINENNKFIEQDIYDVNDLQKQIASLCVESMEPKIRPEFLPITYNNKNLLAVKINEIPQKQKPCYYKGSGMLKGSYIRVGDSDEHMTDSEIYSLQSYREGTKEKLNESIEIKSHMLRHTYGTRFIEAGMPAVVLRRLMGHKDIKVTLNTYTSVFNKFKENEIDKVNNYLVNNNLNI